MNDPDIYAIKINKDEPLGEEEVVEIFIDEDGDGKEYLDLEINPLNTIIDLRMPQPTKDGDVQPWQPKAVFNGEGIKTAVKVYGTVDRRDDIDDKWIAEIAIPFNKVNFPYAKNLPPKQKDMWRVNMFRLERPLPDKVRKSLGPDQEYPLGIYRNTSVKSLLDNKQAFTDYYKKLYLILVKYV